MDFAILPPEVNSARMYAGPGSGSILAAAAAWNELAAELEAAANSYQSVISGLTGGPWLGPSSASMAAAAAPYVGWLTTTAAKAAQTATQAQAAAAAYETAFAGTVPPPVIAANRALLMTLVATNVFGQNTPAIAATESQYAEMWSQDAAAMYGYAGSTATATSALPAFDPAPQTTTGAPAGAGPPTVLPQLASTALQGLASTVSPAQAVTLPPLFPPDVLSTLSGLAGVTLFGPSAAAAGLEPVDIATDFVDTNVDEQDIGLDEGLEEGAASAAVLAPQGAVATLSTGPATVLSQAGAVPVTAGLDRAASVGGLSVPPAWAAAAPAIRPTAMALPAAALGAAPEVWANSTGSLFGDMAMASMAGGAIGSTASMGGRAVLKKPGEPTEYRRRIAATFGCAVTGAAKDRPAGNSTVADHGAEQLLEQVAKRYPGVFALLGALGSANECSTEAGLAKLEREISEFARRFTAAK